MDGGNGVVTRLQNKRARDTLSGLNDQGKRSSKDLMSIQDGENVDAGTSLPYSRKSYPLEHESEAWSKNEEKTSKTEKSAKSVKKGTLTDRGQNSGQCPPVVETVQPAKPKIKDTLFTSFKIIVEVPTGYGKYLPLDDDAAHTFPWTNDPDPWTYFLRHPPVEVPEDYLPWDYDYVPRGIPDIDANPDSINTSVYSKRIMANLVEDEFSRRILPDFLIFNKYITPRMRSILMDWLLQVAHHEELTDESLQLCVDTVDRYLHIDEIPRSHLQLVGVTALLLAAKYTERFAPEISTLCYLTDNTFQKQQILRCERQMLKALDFFMGRPVMVQFLDRFLQVHKNPPEVECLARYICDLSITSYKLSSNSPSYKAAGALALARRLLLDEDEPTWSKDLTFYTSYDLEYLSDICIDLVYILIKAPTSKFQGAVLKYNTPEKCFISKSERLAAALEALQQTGELPASQKPPDESIDGRDAGRGFKDPSNRPKKKKKPAK